MWGHFGRTYKVLLHIEWFCLGECGNDKEKDFVVWDSLAYLCYGRLEVRAGLPLNNGGYSWFQTFALFWMLCAFFWVITRRLNFIWRRFGTLCSIIIGRWVCVNTPAYEDGTECSETSAYKIQTPVNYPEESIQQWRLRFQEQAFLGLYQWGAWQWPNNLKISHVNDTV